MDQDHLWNNLDFKDYNLNRRPPLLVTPYNSSDKPTLFDSYSASSYTRPVLLPNPCWTPAPTSPFPIWDDESFPQLRRVTEPDYRERQQQVHHQLPFQPQHQHKQQPLQQRLSSPQLQGLSCEDQQDVHRTGRWMPTTATGTRPYPIRFGDFLTTAPIYQQGGKSQRIESPKFQSANEDFQKVTHNLFRLAQLSHHERNWDNPPRFLSTRVDQLIDDIQPPLLNTELTLKLKDVGMKFCLHVTDVVKSHLSCQLSKTKRTLNDLNPLDVKQSSKLAQYRLKKRLGNKFFQHPQDFTKFENEVGLNISNNDDSDNRHDIGTVNNTMDCLDTFNNVNILNPTLNVENVSHDYVKTVTIADIHVNTLNGVLNKSLPVISEKDQIRTEITVPTANRFSRLAVDDDDLVLETTQENLIVDNMTNTTRKRARSNNTPDSVKHLQKNKVYVSNVNLDKQTGNSRNRKQFVNENDIPQIELLSTQTSSNSSTHCVVESDNLTRESCNPKQSVNEIPPIDLLAIQTTANSVTHSTFDLNIHVDADNESLEFSSTPLVKTVPNTPFNTIQDDSVLVEAITNTNEHYSNLIDSEDKISQVHSSDNSTTHIESFTSLDKTSQATSSNSSTINIESFSSLGDQTTDNKRLSLQAGSVSVFENKHTAHIKIKKTTKVLVIGDSNLRKIDEEKDKLNIPENWEINCIPGANLYKINQLLLELPKKTPILSDIIIAAGMCDNNNSSPQLLATIKTANSLNKRVHFQGIAINENTLNDFQVKNLKHINKLAQQKLKSNYIEPPLNFTTSRDGIHYKTDTVCEIFNSMKTHIAKYDSNTLN